MINCKRNSYTCLYLPTFSKINSDVFSFICRTLVFQYLWQSQWQAQSNTQLQRFAFTRKFEWSPFGPFKDDETRTLCCVLMSSFDHETAGNRLYAGGNFDEGHVLGKYWGCIALILDSEIPYFQWFGHINRALLKAQPFLKTELGPAKLHIIGSKNCALSYMNTIQEDTVFVEGCQTQFFH